MVEVVPSVIIAVAMRAAVSAKKGKKADVTIEKLYMNINKEEESNFFVG